RRAPRDARRRANDGKCIAGGTRLRFAGRRVDGHAYALVRRARRMARLDLDSRPPRMADPPPEEPALRSVSDERAPTGALPETERDRRHQETASAAWYAALGVIAFGTALRIIVGARLPLLP